MGGRRRQLLVWGPYLELSKRYGWPIGCVMEFRVGLDGVLREELSCHLPDMGQFRGAHEVDSELLLLQSTSCTSCTFLFLFFFFSSLFFLPFPLSLHIGAVDQVPLI
ncbi:hypothetical protein BDV37DRAFT_245246 [Aspergillus pseudonomiae]|uniref:Uncharacterized protein n=1 Tax=Aspergillus pseudonomiae TaxID=1506151 RepID=A0A5N7DGA2_9EURO|nr:uncharacterized protein BDV37DRAFT_245246 [Aspergillus pseudonomiae]KAE8405239.1 hypothetical protein BDV37DRAFT_245246 [Aspergillus pseudonomiae]